MAWAAVGNLNVTYAAESVWRAYSPPGTNQSTTIGVPLIQVYNEIIAPTLTTPTVTTTTNENEEQQQFLQFSLMGQSNVTYLVESTTDLESWTPVSTNYSSTLTERPFTFAITNELTFYRASVLP